MFFRLACSAAGLLAWYDGNTESLNTKPTTYLSKQLFCIDKI
jgi:hypothetical protein